jgi:hypothetical protein
MSMPAARLRGVAALAWALVGLLSGHFIAYLAVFPDADIHNDVLTRTGHGWLWIAGPAIAMGLAIAVAAGLVSGRRSGARGVSFRALAAIQVTTFVAIELAERAAMGADTFLHELFGHGLWIVLIIGIAVQLVTARIGSTASELVAEAARAPKDRPGRPRPLTILRDSVVAIHDQAQATHHSRGPPLVAPARSI